MNHGHMMTLNRPVRTQRKYVKYALSLYGLKSRPKPLKFPGFKTLSIIDLFLPRDATQSAALPRRVVHLSVRLSVTLRYYDHIGWNSSKIITRLIRLGVLFLQISASVSSRNSKRGHPNRGR